MESRRSFIIKTLTGAAGLAVTGIPLDALADSKVKLTILHTNDMHSRVDPFPSDAGTHAGFGGMSRRAAIIAKIRSEESNVLLLDAGDIFQGTPFFNFFGGEVEFKLMSKMGYDAATLGNHDFDNGLEGLVRQLPNAQFPFLCANYDFSDTILANTFNPYKIFNKSGIKIGVFGLGIELAGLVPPAMYANTKYLDPISVAKEMVQELKSKGCNLIICLSHLGYKYNDGREMCDITLANKVNGIDLIIGGHTHTFLPEPVRILNKDGAEILINQVGWAGINLGRIDYIFQRKIKQNAALSNPIKIS